MNEEFSSLERAFAAALDPSEPPFLCHLLAQARRGHLCVRSAPVPLPNVLVAEGGNCPTSPVVHEKGRIYLQRNWVLETRIVEEIRRLLKTEPDDLFAS